MENFNNYSNMDNIEYAAIPDMDMARRTPVREEGGMVLGMAYVKRQRWGEVYDDETALTRGTLFPALNYPWKGEGGGSAL